MGKNLIPVIAKELGVEIGEEFEIKGNRSSKYRFKNDRLESKYFSDDNWQTSMSVLNQLGDIEIIKLPFEPKYGEQYWTYTSIPLQILGVTNFTWSNDIADLKNKKLGWVFRSREEAIKARPIKFKELTGEEWVCDDG